MKNFDTSSIELIDNLFGQINFQQRNIKYFEKWSSQMSKDPVEFLRGMELRDFYVCSTLPNADYISCFVKCLMDRSVGLIW